MPSREGRQDKEDNLCKKISAATNEYMSQGRLARRLKDQLKELRLGSAESDMVISLVKGIVINRCFAGERV